MGGDLPQPRRNASTASTRRLSSGAWCSPSLVNTDRDVGLHRLRAEVQPLADRLVGAALGHHGQHLPLPLGQLVERVAGPAAADELGHHGRVDHQPARGDPADRVGQLVDVGDALLEQVAGAVRAGLDQFAARNRGSTCAESTSTPTAGWLSLERAGGVEALGGVGRRHPDVDHDDVGRVGAHGVEQRLRVPDLGGHREPGVGEQPAPGPAGTAPRRRRSPPAGPAGSGRAACRQHRGACAPSSIRPLESRASAFPVREAAQRRPLSSALAMNPRATLRPPPAVVAARPARHQHHRRGRCRRDQLLGDAEPVACRAAARRAAPRRAAGPGPPERRGAVAGLAHHVETVGDQHDLGQRPERRMIVDDQHPDGHPSMVLPGPGRAPPGQPSTGGRAQNARTGWVRGRFRPGPARSTVDSQLGRTARRRAADPTAAGRDGWRTGRGIGARAVVTPAPGSAAPAGGALWWLLWAAAALAELAALAPVVLAGGSPVEAVDVVFRLIGGSFAACGLIAWRRRPDSRIGLLMTATGFAFFVSPLLRQTRLAAGADGRALAVRPLDAVLRPAGADVPHRRTAAHPVGPAAGRRPCSSRSLVLAPLFLMFSAERPRSCSFPDAADRRE